MASYLNLLFLVGPLVWQSLWSKDVNEELVMTNQTNVSIFIGSMNK